jgi:hypothetical protein
LLKMSSNGIEEGINIERLRPCRLNRSEGLTDFLPFADKVFNHCRISQS